MHIGKNILRFLKSFRYAASGLLSAVIRERNMRFHLGAAAFVIWIMRFYDLTAGESAAIYLCVGAVLALELMNTAIENTVDLISKDRNNNAKTAKDCAAGAVLVMAFISVVCAVYILWDKSVFAHIWKVMTDKPYRIVIFCALALLWLGFVFIPGSRKVNFKEDEK